VKLRKMKRARARLALKPGYLSSVEAALVLHVSRQYFDQLVRTGKLGPSRYTRDGHRRFAASKVLAYKKRVKVTQRAGLKKMMEATRRMGLYDAELDGTPSAASKRRRFYRFTFPFL
jgi:excisionase family DNA binding protein